MADQRTESKRVYDKSERRFKHVGNGPAPTIEFDFLRPRKWVGKCPNTIPDAKKTELLNTAIAAPNGDRDIAYIKTLYVVHEGAVHEAQTSDAGRSYHAYPYKGKLSSTLMAQLEAMAVTDRTVTAFRNWANKYLETGGKR